MKLLFFVFSIVLASCFPHGSVAMTPPVAVPTPVMFTPMPQQDFATCLENGSDTTVTDEDNSCAYMYQAPTQSATPASTSTPP